MKNYEEVKQALTDEDIQTLAEIGWNYLQSRKEGDSR